MGLSSSPRQYFKTLKKLQKEWKNINRKNIIRSARKLSEEKLVEEIASPDGSFKLILTKEGLRQAKLLGLIGKSIKFKKPKRWDKKWRIVIFDIPERNRLFRDILRDHLRTLDFFKLQNSVFVSPYSFEKTILELVSLYSAEPYVRVITAGYIDNEKRLKKHFFGK